MEGALEVDPELRVTDRMAQGALTRTYYGHAFQVPAGPPIERDEGADDVVWAIDPEVLAAEPLVPWSTGPRRLQRVRFQRNATDPPGDYVIDGDHDGPEADPTSRVDLARHEPLRHERIVDTKVAVHIL